MASPVRAGTSITIDVGTGEVTSVEGGAFTMLPAPAGTCPECACEHAPENPHNLQSFYYAARFEMLHGRKPTWSDAMAHCTPELQAQWKRELRKLWQLRGLAIPPDMQG